MPSIQFYLGENIEENMYKKINGISSNLKKKPEDIISFIESFGFNFIEFVDEYKSHMAVMGNESFAAGLLFPAIPVWIERNIGVDIVKHYLDEINH